MKDYILEENIFAIAGFNNPNQTLDKKMKYLKVTTLF